MKNPLMEYEPTGGRTNIGACAEVSLIGGHINEQDAMLKVYTGIASTWGLDRDIVRNPPPSLIKATAILALAGEYWVGQQLESFGFSFAIKDVSRGFTHQLVRARFMAFGQEGTRDTNQCDFDACMPATIGADVELSKDYRSLMDSIRSFMTKCNAKGIPYQDSSYASPKGLLTDIVCHASFRALQEFVQNRLSNTMHWEINTVAKQMRDLVLDIYPTIGLWLVPRCEIAGRCLSSATLFPPCGKLPAADMAKNKFGEPFEHPSRMNPAANPLKVSAEQQTYLWMANARAEAIKWAKEVTSSFSGKETSDPGG